MSTFVNKCLTSKKMFMSRESNPEQMNGNHLCCHYTTHEQVESLNAS